MFINYVSYYPRSPLFISTDLTNPSTQTLNILQNTRIIALNVCQLPIDIVAMFLIVPCKLQQDPLGKSISFRRRYTNDHDVWAGPLADGSTVARTSSQHRTLIDCGLTPSQPVLINWQNSSRSLTFNLADVGLASANAVDLITGTSLGKLTSTSV